MYFGLVFKIQQSTNVKKSQITSHKVNVRLGAVIITNFIPWILVTILTLMSIVGLPPPQSLEAILGVVLFPLNALLNPLVNTITTTEFHAIFYTKIKPDPKKKD
jgi:hypothetical protein